MKIILTLISGLVLTLCPSVSHATTTLPSCKISGTFHVYHSDVTGDPIAFRGTIKKNAECLSGHKRPLFRVKIHCSLGIGLPTVWQNGNSVRRPRQSSFASCANLGATAQMFVAGWQWALNTKDKFGKFHRVWRS